MRARSDTGQATVLTVVFLVVLLGMAALVLDIGSWYRADRATQSTADAAALAGAQALPYNTGNATTLALQYADKNGSGLSASDIAISNGVGPDDTIQVYVHRPASGVFTKLFGVNSVTVGSRATARASLMQQAQFVAPIGVNVNHPKLKGTSTCPCFGTGNLTTLPLGKTGAPGAFDVFNLDGSRGGTGPPILADWILHGFSGYLPIGNYYSDPGAKWNSSQVQSALTQRLDTTLLFPVYDTLTGNGANAQYHVVGWVGFHMTAFSARGNSGSITGYFTQVVWDGIESTTSNGSNPDLGARTVKLIG
ncbi:MAG: pilus assembly protein TadG-related protein [Gaiellaceae bacterium]